MASDELESLLWRASVGEWKPWDAIVGQLAEQGGGRIGLMMVGRGAQAASVGARAGQIGAWAVWEAIRRVVHAALCDRSRIAGFPEVAALAEAGRLYGADEWVSAAVLAMDGLLAAGAVGGVADRAAALHALDQADPFEPRWRALAGVQALADGSRRLEIAGDPNDRDVIWTVRAYHRVYRASWTVAFDRASGPATAGVVSATGRDMIRDLAAIEAILDG